MKFWQRMAQQFLKLRKQIRKRYKAITALAAVVVFITTYALILPAITEDSRTAASDPAISVGTATTEDQSADEAGSGQEVGSGDVTSTPETAETPAEETGGGETSDAQTDDLITEDTALQSGNETDSIRTDAEANADGDAHQKYYDMTGENEDYRVTISFDRSKVTNIPDHAAVSVKSIPEESIDYSYAEKLSVQAKKENDPDFDEDSLGFRVFDICITDGDTKIEPNGPVKVSVEMKNLPDGTDEDTKFEIGHIREEENKEDASSQSGKLETVADGVSFSDGRAEAEFTVDSFSTFTVTWRKAVSTYSVRIHYADIDGNEIPGPAGENIEFKNSETVTFADYSEEESLPGYVFKGAHLDSFDGKEVTDAEFTGSVLKSWTCAYKNGDEEAEKDESGCFDSGVRDVYLVYARQIKATLGGKYSVTVEYGDGTLPEGTAVSLRKYSEEDEEYKNIYSSVMGNTDPLKEGQFFDAIDISLENDGKEIQPEDGKNVTILLKDDSIPSDADLTYLSVYHMEDDEAVKMADKDGDDITLNGTVSTAEFEVSHFSVFAETNAVGGGEIRDSLDGDWAYISDFSMVKDGLVTGTAPWDADDEAGNDNTERNNILRTFDTATYTLQFNTKLREEIQRRNVGGIRQGRLYFEFILPVSADEARFETDSMGWLKSNQNIKYETVTEDVSYDFDGDGSKETKSCQVLRGSYTLVPSEGNSAAIGASTQEFQVVLRALKMHNQEKIKPVFTLWLNHNNVGCTYDSEDECLPESIVTGTDVSCSTVDDKTQEAHSKEAKTLEGQEITVSARGMYNLQVRNALDVRNTKVGTYNFDTEADAINYGKGSVYGRLNGYGLIVELRGKTGQGLRGCELPDENTPITFNLNLTAKFSADGGKQQDADAFTPLFYAGDQNIESKTNVYKGRSVDTQNGVIVGTPYNKPYTSDGNLYRSCNDGGNWSFSQNDDGTIQVSVSGFKINTDKTPYAFPYSSPSGSRQSTTYYNPETINNWWELQEAIFSTGRVYVVQPYYTTDGSHTYVLNYFKNSSGKEISRGTFYTTICDSDMSLKSESGITVTTQMVTSDDLASIGQYLEKEGSISGGVKFVAYKGGWNTPYSGDSNSLQNDTDWGTAGSNIEIYLNMNHDGAEGMSNGVASDNLVKWDDKFFMPDNCIFPYNQTGGNVGNGDKYDRYLLWAAKEDKSGWSGEEEMKQATEDDLVYFEKLTDLEKAGYTPVGALVEWRGVNVEGGMNHRDYFISGYIKADCPAGQTYMIVRNSYAWRKADVAEAALTYYNSKHSDSGKSNSSELTNSDYYDYLVNGFITHRSDVSNTSTIYSYESGSRTNTLNSSVPKPFWYEDYINNNSCRGAAKAAYDANGTYHAGTGAPRFEDSCLVIGFKATVTKRTAQTESNNINKTNYDMNQSQRTVDYEITPTIARESRTVSTSSSGSSLDTVVYVKDTLPASLTYISGSSRLGGIYAQDPRHRDPGTVTDGNSFTTVQTLPAAYNDSSWETSPYQETVEQKSDGTTVIRWAFRVTINLNETTWTSPIRFSCTIGHAGNEAVDVKNGEDISNTVTVEAIGDSLREKSEINGNKAVFGITVSKSGALSLSKIADSLVVDKGQAQGFTMVVGNNGNTPRSSTVIAETIPYNQTEGVNISTFNGDLKVSEFSYAIVDSTGNTLTPGQDGFDLYYTTDDSYKGYKSADYTNAVNSSNAEKEEAQKQNVKDWLKSNNKFTKLNFASATTTINERGYYSALNLPDDLTAGSQITGIVAVGDLPANATMYLHISIVLPDADGGDSILNYLSQDDLSIYARSSVVTRSISGLAWLDKNADGLQSTDETRINGIKVSLYRLKENGDANKSSDYEPYQYPKTQTNVEINTGKQVDILKGGSSVKDYSVQGGYLFTSMQAGTYAIRFSQGTESNPSIGDTFASPVHAGKAAANDTEGDSDGVATYKTSGDLDYTEILGIVMQDVGTMNDGNLTVQNMNHLDSGFYRPADIKILKTDNSADPKPLAGSQFKLFRKNTKNTWEQITKANDASKNYFEVAANGKSITKLESGDYKLTESRAPDGYIIETADTYFTVYSKDNDPMTSLSKTQNNKNASLTESTKNDDGQDGKADASTITIRNTPGAELPSTGGSGTLIYTVLGLVMILGAGAAYGFYTRRTYQ